MLPDIRDLIPHAGAMVLLDRIIAADSENLIAEVTIRADSLFCHNGSVGAWVGIEYMAQAIAAQAGYQAFLRGQRIKIGFLLGTRRYKSQRNTFEVGETLSVHVQLELQDANGLGAFACQIKDAAGIIATANITVYQPPNAELFLQQNGAQHRTKSPPAEATGGH